MVYNLSKNNPLIGTIMSELRDAELQCDRMRFRTNLERIGMLAAYEISKKLPTMRREVETSLGTAHCEVLGKHPVLATILRAGLPLHNGLLKMFDQADSAFISAYRKHHKSGKFTIKLEYLSCPDLDNRILILSDPMLATGASMGITLDQLLGEGDPEHVHIVTAVACSDGIKEVQRRFGDVITIWAGDIDEELTAKGYIVPGLGDAGDLAFGTKLQD